MKYVGSKQRIAKPLLYPMLKTRRPGQYFVDLFVGGANVICHARNPRIGNDIDGELIAMYKALDGGWRPPTYVSEETYYTMKLNQEQYAPELLAFVKYGCAYAGKRWDTYSRNGPTDRPDLNRTLQSYNNVMRQVPLLRGVVWYNLDYREVPLPDNSIVYCDIPYKYCHDYDIDFDHEYFWHWAKIQSHRGRTIYVSSYEAPRGFVSIRDIETRQLIKMNGDQSRTEKLFVWGR